MQSYDDPLTTKWCKRNKDIDGRNGCNDDYQCLLIAKDVCDNDPYCHGVMWNANDITKKLKICLSRELEPKNDGWHTRMKSESGNHISISKIYQYLKSISKFIIKLIAYHSNILNRRKRFLLI